MPPKKILVLALSGIGNFIMQMPVLAAIKQQYPDSHITAWVAPRGTRILAEHNPHLDHIIEAPYKQGLAGHLRQADGLHRQHFDMGFVLYPGQLLKSAGYLYAANIPRRFGHVYPLGPNPRSSFLLTDPVAVDGAAHDIKQNLNLIRQQADPPGWRAHYSLTIPPRYQQQAQRLRRELKIPAGKTFIGIHPGSSPGMSWKRWPIDHFAFVARALIEKYNAHILIFGGPDEEELKQKLYSLLTIPPTGGTPPQAVAHYSLGRPQATIIHTDLLTTAAIAQKCSLFISNDSGLMHLAAAAGTPTLGLFGPTNEHKIGPRGWHSFTLRAPGTKPVYNVNTNFDLGTSPHATLQMLTTTAVLTEAQRILNSI